MHLKIPLNLAALVLPALTACTTISPSGMIAASRLDPLGTPPDRIAAAVGVPETIRLASGDAVLRIAFRGGDAASVAQVEEVVPLDFQTATANAPSGREGETVYVARLTPQNAGRFAAAQEQIRGLREQGVRGSGVLAVEIVSGCHVGPAPSTLPVSSWLQTNPADGFVQLTQGTDVFSVTDGHTASELRSRLREC